MERRRDLACALAAGAASFLVYLRTLAPGLVADVDTPMFQFVGRVLGVPHNPGYPLYVLVTHLFSYVPVGSLPYRINLFSALMGAVAVALTFLAARALGCRRLPSAVAALGLAFGPVFWSQAVIAEVYTMHTALVAAALLGFLEWGKARRPSWFYAGVAALAAGLSHHTTIIAFVAAAAVYALLTDRALVLRARTLATSAGILACGLLPYLFIVIRSNQPGAYLESKATSVAQLPDVILARQFQDRVFAFDLKAVVGDRLPGLVAGPIAGDLTIPGLALAAIGVVALATRWKARGAALSLLLIGAGSIITFAVNYSVVDTPVFLIPAMLVGWLLAGAGVDWLADRAGARKPQLAAIVAGAALLLPAWQLARNFVRLDRSGDTATAVVLDMLFDTLPERAALVHEDFLVDRLIMFKRLTDESVRRRGIGIVDNDPALVRRRLERGQPVFSFARSGRRLRLHGLQVGFDPQPLPAVTFDELTASLEDRSVVAVAAPANVAAQFAASRGASFAVIGGPRTVSRSGAGSVVVVGARGVRAGAIARADAPDIDVEVAATREIGGTGQVARAGFSVHASSAEAAIRQGGRDLVRTTAGVAVAVWGSDGRLAQTLVLQALDGFRAPAPSGALSVFPVRRAPVVEVSSGAWHDVTHAFSSGGVVIDVPPGGSAVIYLADDAPLAPRVVDRRGSLDVAIDVLAAPGDRARRERLQSDGVGTALGELPHVYRAEVRGAAHGPASALLAVGGLPIRTIARGTPHAAAVSLVPIDYSGLLRTPDRDTELLQMSRDEQSHLVGAGWSNVQADAGGGYRWMAGGRTARIVLPATRDFHSIRVQAIGGEHAGRSSLALAIDGIVLTSRPVREGWASYSWTIPAALSASRTAELSFIIDVDRASNIDLARAVGIGDVRLISR